MVTNIKKVSAVLTKIMKYVIIALFIWMTVSLSIQVVARYIFMKSFVWSEESARYCMIWMIFLGAAEVIFNSEHIKVTIVEDLLGGLGKKVIIIIQNIIGLIFSVILLWYSFPQVKLASLAVSSNMDINMGIIYAIFPVAAIMMILGYLAKIVLLIADKGETSGPENGGMLK